MWSGAGESLLRPEILCRKENCFLERSLSEARSWLFEMRGSGERLWERFSGKTGHNRRPKELLQSFVLWI